MKKIYFLLFALGVIASSAFAQNDANAKKLLDAVSTKIKSSPGVSASFSMVTKSRTGKVVNNVTGKISLKGNKFYIRQGASEIFSDGNKTWNYNGNNEVTVTEAATDDNAFSPEKLFSGTYDKDYSYKVVSTRGTYNQIQLVPFDKRKQFQKITLYVDKSKSLITKAQVVDKGNNTTDLSLSSINTSANIADATFVFNKSKYKKDIEVIE